MLTLRKGVERLTTEDATYWFLSRALDWSVVLQIVWVFDERVPSAHLSLMNTALMNTTLASGRLHRRLHHPRVPGARPRWSSSREQSELVLDDEAVASDELEDWAVRELAEVDLDAVAGRCWQLRAADTTSGGTVLSLCALHIVADGRTLVQAAGEAMRATPDAVPQGRLRTPRAPLPADLLDSTRQLLAIGSGIYRAAMVSATNSLGRAGGNAPTEDLVRPTRSPAAQRAPAAAHLFATATVPSAEWDAVAAAHGGTANSLFVAVVTGVLRASGHSPLGVPIKVGIPVDQRVDDDDRANAVAGVSVMLTDDPTPGGDLGRIRALCKAAFGALAAGRRPAMIHLQPLVWLVPPAWLIPVVTSGSGMPDAMASNLGDIGGSVLWAGPVRASRVMFRGMAQGVDPASSHRFGDGIQSWLLRAEDNVTFSVLGFDESCFGEPGRLAELLDQELTGWGLTHRIW